MSARAAAGLLLGLGLGCGTDVDDDAASTRLPPGFEVRLDQVRYRRVDHRGLQIEASTDHALLSPSSGQTRFSRLELTHRAVDGEGAAATLVAGGGSSNLMSGKLLLTEGVRVEDAQGRVLDVPSAAYDPEARALAGPGPATLAGPNFLLRAAKGAVIDVDQGAIDLIGPVSGFVEPL